MARLPRLVVPGMPHHVIQRGTARCAIFRDSQDYRFFMGRLWDLSDETRCDIHAYVLMSNHLHLLLTPQNGDGLSKLLQRVGSRYVQYFNNRYERTGALWQSRYRAVPVDSEGYLLVCTRYIELNPVRAGMVKNPADYSWSSYEHHALGRIDPVIRDHDVLLSLGRTSGERCAAYLELFQEQLAESTLQAIREATNKGWPLGSPAFQQKLAALSPRRVVPLPRGGDHRAKRAIGSDPIVQGKRV